MLDQKEQKMDGQTDEIRSHYHFVYEKKIPRGVIKILVEIWYYRWQYYQSIPPGS